MKLLKPKFFVKSIDLARDRFVALCILSIAPLLLALYGLSVAFLPTQAEWYNQKIWLISFFEGYFFETILFILALRVVAALQKMQIWCYLLISIILSTLIIQACSLIIGNEFLSPLAIENLFHSDFVLGNFVYLTPIAIIAFWFFSFFIIAKYTKPRIWRLTTTFFATVLLLVTVALYNSSKYLPHDLQINKEKIFQRVGIDHTGAVHQLLALLKQSTKENKGISTTEIGLLRDLGIKIRPSSSYPFVRDKIYSGPGPLRSFGIAGPRKPNVVLLFTEGMSARSIMAYNSALKLLGQPLTPKLSEFAKSGIMVKNYWNHTAASYRGMRGQLCSMYPINDGTEPFQGRPDLVPPDYFCITHALREVGYKTFFINAHTKESSFLDEIMPPLGFDKMLNAKELSVSHLGGVAPAQKVSLSDSQFFEALYGEIARHEKNPDNSPFFIAAYNLGTHAFFNVAPGEIKYADGKNNALNTIHNFDFHFGKFWTKLQKLSISTQTIFIFTTDHCHYAEKSFVDFFDSPDYQKQFIDKIPLIIQVPGIHHSIVHEAYNATSASLAPSIAHLLELPNLPTPWVAKSIFDKSPNGLHTRSLAGYVDHRYLISGEQLHRLPGGGQNDPLKNAIHSFFDFSISLERQNRIWDPSLRTPQN